jgi:hypothetical protein
MGSILICSVSHHPPYTRQLQELHEPPLPPGIGQQYPRSSRGLSLPSLGPGGVEFGTWAMKIVSRGQSSGRTSTCPPPSCGSICGRLRTASDRCGSVLPLGQARSACYPGRTSSKGGRDLLSAVVVWRLVPCLSLFLNFSETRSLRWAIGISLECPGFSAALPARVSAFSLPDVPSWPLTHVRSTVFPVPLKVRSSRAEHTAS